MKPSTSAGLLITAAILAGCATVNKYDPPQIDSAATLTGSTERNGVFDWEWVGIQNVDDKYVPLPFMASAASTKTKLSPEHHRLLVQTAFNRTFSGGGPYEAYVAVDFTPQPNGHYRLNSSVRDNVIQVWVEDAVTKETVSEMFSAPFRTQPQTTYVTVYTPPLH